MPKDLIARVIHLEMQQKQQLAVPPPLSEHMALMRVNQMPVHFYRYLYEQIGKAHHWVERNKMSDKALAKLLSDENTFIHILYIDGNPAGFAEINFTELPAYAEIVYFGLIPEFQGRGLSRFFFHETVNAAWERDPEKLKIQTNNFDSPRALQLYQAAGFSPVSFSEEKIK